MSRVQTLEISQDDADQRLDRWFRRLFNHIPQSYLQKLLRTGQIRVDGGRIKASHRLEVGQKVRIPPLPDPDAEPRPKSKKSNPEDAEFVQNLIIYKDKSVLVLNKPAGLAVQGGSKIVKHLDAMLDFLCFEANERPRLVHRLDKDTSGVLLLARTRSAAAKLARSFQARDAEKLYWALVIGVPKPEKGVINLPLKKGGGEGNERVYPAEPSDKQAKTALTDFAVIQPMGQQFAWVCLRPRTGRTHQLRVHMAAIGHPLVGDGKYGGSQAHPGGEMPRKLHLHASALDIAHPDGGRLKVAAELSGAMAETWQLFGFDHDVADNPFQEF